MFRSKKKEDQPVEEILKVDMEHGIVTRNLDGSRVMALGSHGWATIEKELETTFITGAAVILQRLGYSYGRAVGRAAKRQELDPELAFEAMQNLARESGWGGFILNSGDLNSGEARITVKDCFFCLHARESTEPVCHVLTGLVGGMADEILNVSHRVSEEKCIAKGDSVCEILIERLG
ncbi:MAG TPA: V4R domain-containing protein [Nitrososphaerales archaeon]|nr:V4R domain-containing protein [Nitrososphaerales archaeon]